MQIKKDEYGRIVITIAPEELTTRENGEGWFRVLKYPMELEILQNISNGRHTIDDTLSNSLISPPEIKKHITEAISDMAQHACTEHEWEDTGMSGGQVCLDVCKKCGYHFYY